MARPIQTGRKRSRVESLATTGSWAAGVASVEVLGLGALFTDVLRNVGLD
ncbi:hypothetical protein GCM10009740_14430 [Terrabacter terrae]|uniref:MFS transporter n=1 Tax=Terrabacter terrae TaxID=318434 RepID=A0ABN2U1S5_9MICO